MQKNDSAHKKKREPKNMITHVYLANLGKKPRQKHDNNIIASIWQN